MRRAISSTAALLGAQIKTRASRFEAVTGRKVGILPVDIGAVGADEEKRCLASNSEANATIVRVLPVPGGPCPKIDS